MHLTPVFARGSRRTHGTSCHLMRFAATAFLMACARTTPVPAPTTPVQPVVSPPAAAPQPIPVRSSLITPDSALYDVMSTVVGSDVDVPSAPRDSVIYRELVSSILTIGPDSSITVTAQSDSGYQLPRGRDIPPELVARARPPIRVSVQRDFLTQRVLNSTSVLECSPAATLVSPVMPTLVLQFVMQTRRESRIMRDSLSYTACQTGVLVRYTLYFASDSILPARSADSVFRYRITGAVAADSSRVLPMRMAGQISGDAEIRSQSTSRVLPAEVRIRLRGDLIFQSTTRTQHLQQLVTTTFAIRQ